MRCNFVDVDINKNNEKHVHSWDFFFRLLLFISVNFTAVFELEVLQLNPLRCFTRQLSAAGLVVVISETMWL